MNESDRADSIAPHRVIGLYAAEPATTCPTSCVCCQALPVVLIFMEVIIESKLRIKIGAPASRRRHYNVKTVLSH